MSLLESVRCAVEKRKGSSTFVPRRMVVVTEKTNRRGGGDANGGELIHGEGERKDDHPSDPMRMEVDTVEQRVEMMGNASLESVRLPYESFPPLTCKKDQVQDGMPEGDREKDPMEMEAGSGGIGGTTACEAAPPMSPALGMVRSSQGGVGEDDAPGRLGEPTLKGCMAMEGEEEDTPHEQPVLSHTGTVTPRSPAQTQGGMTIVMAAQTVKAAPTVEACVTKLQGSNASVMNEDRGATVKDINAETEALANRKKLGTENGRINCRENDHITDVRVRQKEGRNNDGNRTEEHLAMTEAKGGVSPGNYDTGSPTIEDTRESLEVDGALVNVGKEGLATQNEENIELEALDETAPFSMAWNMQPPEQLESGMDRGMQAKRERGVGNHFVGGSK